MGINDLNITEHKDPLQQMRLREMEMRKSTLELLLGSGTKSRHVENHQKDSYICQQESSPLFANYTSNGTFQQNQNGVSKEDIWDYLSTFTGGMTNGEFTVNGQKCHVSQIEKMGEEILEKPKAVENVLTLKSGVYYGIATEDDGEERMWGMCVYHGTYGSMLSLAGSELKYAVHHGIVMAEMGEWTKFFRSAGCGKGDAAAAGISIQLSYEKVQTMLDELGFEPGICKIIVDGQENTFFYSNNGRVYPQYHYDAAYSGMTQGDNRQAYEIGAEFNYNGNIYQMDEEGHINVPYGEDIFNCLSRPPGIRSQQKESGQSNQ